MALYGVSLLLIEYSAHNWRYCDFTTSETLILAILGHFYTRWTQNLRKESSATPRMTYRSQITIHIDIIWSFIGSNQIFCSQLAKL